MRIDRIAELHSGLFSLLAVLLLAASPAAGEESAIRGSPFNWDLVSLEQNNPRSNASVLTGFHSVRSPGVTPWRAWKAGLGLLYTREEQVATAGELRLFDRNQVIVNPKINHGFLKRLEGGAGLTASYASGRELMESGGSTIDEREENLDLGSVDLGIKWNFLDVSDLRLALAFDTRLALNRGDFGQLPGTLFNFELDGDYAITRRFGVVGNLQLITSDSDLVTEQVIVDGGATYSFTNRFRGMLFGTVQEDDEAGAALGFVGVAGQYIVKRHSFTLAFDLQLNDAEREVRTEEQLGIELSYTFTF